MMSDSIISNYIRVFDAGGPIAWCIFTLSIILYATAINALWIGSITAHPAKRIKRTMTQFREMVSGNSYWNSIFEKLHQLERNPKATLKFIRNSKARLNRTLKSQVQRLRVGASAATLLGLLGTITGMIETFSAISSSGNAETANLVARGISKALITTNVGLVVAIPAVMISYKAEKQLKLALQLFEEVERGSLMAPSISNDKE